jgi:EpsI family protein
MISLPRFLIVYALLAATALVIMFHRDSVVPINRTFSEFPRQVKSWQMTSQEEFSDDIIKVLKPTDYLSRKYRDASGNTVSLYIGYHGGGKDGGEIHSPKQCLPGGGWMEMSSKRGSLVSPDGPINLVRAVYQKGDNRELFLYWFQVRDRSISEEFSLKLAEIVNSMLHRRRDASFIRVSVPVGSDVAQATALGDQFIRDVEPLFKEYLPR